MKKSVAKNVCILTRVPMIIIGPNLGLSEASVGLGFLRRVNFDFNWILED